MEALIVTIERVTLGESVFRVAAGPAGAIYPDFATALRQVARLLKEYWPPEGLKKVGAP